MRKKYIVIFIFLIAAGYFLGKHHVVGDLYYSLRHLMNRSEMVSEDLSSDKELKLISINVEDSEFEKIIKKREDALQKKYLLTSGKDYVNAKLKTDTFESSIKLRLKGDLPDHLEGEKWSFRIKMIDGDYNGMSKFSIQTPETREMLNEWFAMKIMERENLLFVQYNFANISINNKAPKVYAIEEAFSHSFLKNRALDGLIIKFDEDLMYKEKVHLKDYKEFKNRAFNVSNIEAFGMKEVLKNDTLKQYFLEAKTLLEKFKKGELITSEVFDLKKLSEYYALCNVLGAEHGMLWNNSRFYYNPDSKKLEPIAYDLNAREINDKRVSNDSFYGLFNHGYHGERSYYERMFFDTVFLKEYHQAVLKYANSNIIEDTYEELKTELQYFEYMLYDEYKDYRFLIQHFTKNQKILQNLYKPIKTTNAYLEHVDSVSADVTIGNVYTLPIQVLSIQIDNRKYIPVQNVILSPIIGGENVDYTKFNFKYTEKVELKKDAYISYKILGTNSIFEDKIYPYQFELN